MLAEKKHPNPNQIQKKLCDPLSTGGLVSQLGSPRVQPGVSRVLGGSSK